MLLGAALALLCYFSALAGRGGVTRTFGKSYGQPTGSSFFRHVEWVVSPVSCFVVLIVGLWLRHMVMVSAVCLFCIAADKKRPL